MISIAAARPLGAGRIIDSMRRGVPTALEELAQLGRTLHRRRHDVLAYFDHHASNGPPPKPSTDASRSRLVRGLVVAAHDRYRYADRSPTAP